MERLSDTLLLWIPIQCTTSNKKPNNRYRWTEISMHSVRVWDPFIYILFFIRCTYESFAKWLFHQVTLSRIYSSNRYIIHTHIVSNIILLFFCCVFHSWKGYERCKARLNLHKNKSPIRQSISTVFALHAHDIGRMGASQNQPSTRITLYKSTLVCLRNWIAFETPMVFRLIHREFAACTCT